MWQFFGESGMRTDSKSLQTALSGYELLNDPLLNKGTAFSEAERDEFDLFGLLPPHVASLDSQVERRIEAFRGLGTDLQKYIFLRGLQDSNETLFYALLTRNIAELMPIVYTPTVGLGCQQFSRIFRKPRGLFLSLPLQDRINRILSNPRFNHVEAIVVSDGERILGLGDQGAGGMGIPIGKLSLYTACAGVHPSTTLPILLDVGTDNRALLDDPLYVGWRQERVRGSDYDNFIAVFVDAVKQRWPHILLHWEDFALGNANRLLVAYRDQLCTFNDDIQGTAAIAVGAILSAINVTGLPVAEQRIAVLGAGTAGTGICALLLRAMTDAGLPEEVARSRFYLVDREGLLIEGMKGLQPFQAKKEGASRWMESIIRPADRTAGGGGQCPSDRAHRDVRPTACLLRRRRAHDGAQYPTTDHFSPFQPDRAKRGDTARSSRLDGGSRGRWHWKPISPDHSEWRAVSDRPSEQFLRFSRCRSRRDSYQGAPHI
jgi:malate dehydrogenase (oxaloacetate-decarboxylating)